MSLAKRTKKGIKLRLAADTIPAETSSIDPIDTSGGGGFTGFNQESVPEFLDTCTTLCINGQDYRVSAEDLQTIRELGRGQYGVVELKRHRSSGIIMAVKGDVMLCMEVLDCSFDKVIVALRDAGERFPEDILGRIAVAVVSALHFLKKELHVMHRDVKPSNILVNRAGEIKLCDFGIAGTLNESLAKTRNVGCNMYMAPERLDPSLTDIEGFDIRSDVWSFGITMLELALLKHPFRFRTIFDQIKQVVNDPSPFLPADMPYTSEMRDFIDKCLIKDFNNRYKYDQLLEHSFITKYTALPVDMSAYFTRVLNEMDAKAGITTDAAASGEPLRREPTGASRRSELNEL